MNKQHGRSRGRTISGQLTVTALVTRRSTVVVAFPADASEDEVEEVLTELLERDDARWESVDESFVEPVTTDEGGYIAIKPAGGTAEWTAHRDNQGELIIQKVQ